MKLILLMTGFTGCVQYFNVSGYDLPVSGHSVMVDVWPSSTLLQSSCSSLGVCLPSPCSEEDTTRGRCLSAHCQTRLSVCGPAVQNQSCICLHNVSDHACDVCTSATESDDRCSEAEAQGSAPLWLIAVILPLISILVIIVMCVALYRVRRQKRQSESSPQKTQQGTDNVAFCFDDNRTLTDAGKEKQHHQVSADQQRSSVEFYSDASLSGVQPVPNSELEYYEIGSISSALHSDTASLKLSWHKSLYSTKCVKSDPKRWGDLRMLLAGFKKEHSSEERAKSSTNFQDVAFLNKQLLTKIDAEQCQQTPPCCKKRFLQPEFLEPVQALTFEEISKLNTPMSQGASPRSGPATMISSDSETDSTFTCSESDCGQFSTIKYRHEQSSLSACSFLPVSSFLQHTCQSAAGLHEATGAPSTIFEQWEDILNMQLPFSSYAPVFEDIARLPTDTSHSYDMQSDIEEII